MASETINFEFRVSYQGSSQNLTFKADENATVEDFYNYIANEFDLINVKILKLIKGKSVEENSEEQLKLLLKDVTKGKKKRINVFGTTKENIMHIEKGLEEHERREEIKKNTGPARMPIIQSKRRNDSPYRFMSHEVREDLENSHIAMEMMESIVFDPALLKVLEKHCWTVEKVIEITKWEEHDHDKLGWNRNKGQVIALRFRHGQRFFMTREEIMETMFHELAHNEIGPHDDSFKALNRQIRVEYFEFQEQLEKEGAFSGLGVRLGGGDRSHRNVSPKEMARRAALARHVELLMLMDDVVFSEEDDDGDISMEEN